jgi:hypothetical protein
MALLLSVCNSTSSRCSIHIEKVLGIDFAGTLQFCWQRSTIPRCWLNSIAVGVRGAKLELA